MKRKKIFSRGSSLVEMIVAIALFAVVTIPIFGIFAASASMLKKSKENIELSAIERQIKADVLFVTSNSTSKLQQFSGPNGVSLPATEGQTAVNCGVLNNVTGVADVRYKYEIKYLEIEENNTDKVFVKPELNKLPGTRYRIDILMLKSNELDPGVNGNFKLIKSFYIETKYE